MHIAWNWTQTSTQEQKQQSVLCYYFYLFIKMNSVSVTKEKLIEIVRQYTCIYDLQHKDYKNVVYKNLLWEQIGAAIGVQGSKAKDMWRTLRDGYIRYKKAVKGQTGSRRKYSNYTWSSQMSFLDGTLELRPTGTNITASQECLDPPLSPLLEPDQSPSSPLSSLTQSQQSQSPPDPSLPSSSAPRTIQNNDVSDDTGLNDTLRRLHYLTNNDNSTQSPTSSPQEAAHVRPQPSQSQSEQQSNKSLPRTTKRRNDSEIRSPDNTERVLDYLRNKKKKEWDSVDYLFMSYAKSFKALPVRKQGEIKVALAKLFADAESADLPYDYEPNIQTESSPLVYLSPAYSVISEDSGDILQTTSTFVVDSRQKESAQVDKNVYVWTDEADEAVDLSKL